MQKMYVLFGVKTSDLEEARAWIEDATLLNAKGFNNEYVGDYYRIGKLGGGEGIKLCSGISEDEDGAYPTEPEFSSWRLLAYLNQTNENSSVLRALEQRQDRFVKLRSNSVGD